MNKKYSLQKSNIDTTKIKIDKKKVNGYKVKPRNKVKEISKVNSVMIVNPSFIDKVLKKKIKKKLDYYFQYIIHVIDDESNDDGESIRQALNDVTRYKSIIEYKYSKYLDQKYICLLLNKLNLLEHELKLKMMYHYVPEIEIDEEKEIKGKSR